MHRCAALAARPRGRSDRLTPAFAFSTLLQVLRSESVKVLGRLHDYPMDERRRQASEKRQGTKSREVSTVSATGYGELASRHTGAIVDFGKGVGWADRWEGTRGCSEGGKEGRRIA